METFSALLALCAGKFTGPGEFSAQRPVTRSFDVFLDLRLNKWLSKQPRGWWFETPLWSLWRQCNESHPWHHAEGVATNKHNIGNVLLETLGYLRNGRPTYTGMYHLCIFIFNFVSVWIFPWTEFWITLLYCTKASIALWLYMVVFSLLIDDEML